MIKHDNIIYARNINKIGGVETYVYELVKKYQDYDIAVVCQTIAPEQKERLTKFCRVYIHKNEPIECKVIITNWDTSIIKYVNKEAKVYTGIHTDYSHPSQGSLPIDNERITYIGITEDSKNKFEKLSGIKRTILCRNPLTVEKEEKPLILVSATRLTKEKGGDRMLALANKMDEQKIKYIWFIFTTDEYEKNPVWKNENIIHMNNRLDLGYFFNLADWYIQCSEVEGDSYSLKEALYRGTPIVACELPYFKEIGIENNKNALFLNLDCSNIDEIINKIKKPLKFKFEPIKDGYDEIMVKGKSFYKEEMKMKVKVQAIKDYFDIETNEKKYVKLPEGAKESQNIWITSKKRAEDLVGYNAVVILEEIKEKPIKKVVEETNEEAVEATKSDVVDEATSSDEMVAKPKKTTKKK